MPQLQNVPTRGKSPAATSTSATRAVGRPGIGSVGGILGTLSKAFGGVANFVGGLIGRLTNVLSANVLSANVLSGLAAPTSRGISRVGAPPASTMRTGGATTPAVSPSVARNLPSFTMRTGGATTPAVSPSVAPEIPRGSDFPRGTTQLPPIKDFYLPSFTMRTGGATTPAVYTPSTSTGERTSGVPISSRVGEGGAVLSVPKTGEVPARAFSVSGVSTVGVRPTTETDINVEKLSSDIQQIFNALTGGGTSQVITNAPAGSSSYVFKDPIGGSTPVFEYTISRGDTLTSIASRFGAGIDEILRLNQDRKNAIKSPDLIIAGQPIRIPLKQQTVTIPEISQQPQAPKTIEDVNNEALKEFDLRQLAKGIVSPQQMLQFTMGLFGQQVEALNQYRAKLEVWNDPNFYENRYRQLLQQYGIEKDMQELLDVQRILRGTWDDLRQEAAISGNIVLQSQLAAIYDSRTKILKERIEDLKNIINLKEGLLDRIMDYARIDRNEYSKYLDNILGIEEEKFKIFKEAADWAYDLSKELQQDNRKELENWAKNGVLHAMPLTRLRQYVNPNSVFYAGIDPYELALYIQMSRAVTEDKERKEREAELRLQNILSLIEQRELQTKEKEQKLKQGTEGSNLRDIIRSITSE